jgi:hypothetical protein
MLVRTGLSYLYRNRGNNGRSEESFAAAIRESGHNRWLSQGASQTTHWFPSRTTLRLHFQTSIIMATMQINVNSVFARASARAGTVQRAGALRAVASIVPR